MKQLTRVCASCKLEKPLAAFLHIDPTKGTSYGNLCSACRGRESRSKVKPSEDDHSRLPSGHRIGAKQKAFSDKEQFRLKKDIDELYKIDLRKKDDQAQEKVEKTKEKNDLSRKQPADTRKLPPRTFLPRQNASGGETAPVLTAGEREQAAREKLSEKEFVAKEIRKSVIDFSAIFYPLQGRAELDSTTVQGYLDLLGEKAPLTQLLKKGFAKMTTFSEKNVVPQKQTDAQKEQDMSNLAKNNWGKKR